MNANKSKNKVLVTGANGFIGKNLSFRLREEANIDVLTFLRKDSDEFLKKQLLESDLLIHLAGENRPKSSKMFVETNEGLTRKICNILEELGKKIPVIFTSSTQATINNDYGKSKLEAENILINFSKKSESPLYIYRLPGVFGKWCRPNYNSVVATFCHNIANNLEINIEDEERLIDLVYIDDVINNFINIANNIKGGIHQLSINEIYKISLGDLANLIKSFRESRNSLISERVGTGITRALYATYMSFLPVKDFSYKVISNEDERGTFVEMLKTKDTGQFSFFTAHPGVTRGGHYHNTKTEKFLILKGKGRFNFRNIISDEKYSIEVSCNDHTIVETIPGWSHDITNIGKEEMIVMLWANEIFDRDAPDTITYSMS